MVVVPAFARILGLLIGARVDVRVEPLATAPFGPLGFGRLASVRLEAEAVPSGRGSAAAILPIQSASLSGEDVQLGWKLPALLLTPLWMVFSPRLLPVLLVIYLQAPNTGAGSLRWEGFASAEDLNRGAWRWLLGRVNPDGFNPPAFRPRVGAPTPQTPIRKAGR